MAISDIVQKRITDLLSFVVTGEKVEIGKSAVSYLRKLLPEVKDKLKLDFDKFEVNPGPHPRDTADVLLFKNKQLVRKLTVKTAVSADIRGAIKRMQQERRYDEDGLLIFGLYCVRDEYKEKVLGLILIPRIVLYEEPVEMIYSSILRKVEEKKRKEHYDEISIVAMNESIILETASSIILNQQAIEENRKALEKNRKAIEENRKAIEENRKAIEENRKAIEEVKLVVDSLRGELNNKFTDLKETLDGMNKLLLKVLQKEDSEDK